MPGSTLDLYASTEDLTVLEEALALRRGPERLPLLVALAWQYRQRDAARSRELAADADALLDDPAISDLDRRRHAARLALVRGEVAWLMADLAAAESLGDTALREFAALGDRAGTGDAYWLLAYVWGDRGDIQGRDRGLDAAYADYVAAGERVRVQVVDARRLLYTAFRGLGATPGRLAQPFDANDMLAPAVVAWLESARALVAGSHGDYAASIRHFIAGHEAALDCGQLRQAMLAATNAADDFSILGDLDAALEWDERALALARAAGWPGAIANALTQTGNVLRLLARHAEARSMLVESQKLRRGLESSNGYAITLGYLGDLALDMGEPALALQYFREAGERGRAMNGIVLDLRARRGEANALCRLDRPDEARAIIAAALEFAERKGNPDERIEMLRVCAELHTRFPLPPPPDLAAPSPALHYLQQAMALAGTIEGYHLPPELLDDLAAAYAACGDYANAYRRAREAAQARDSKRLESGRNRAIALQVKLDSERARADALQSASATLEELGVAGREITASLNPDDVVSTLRRHLGRLLEVDDVRIRLGESRSAAQDDPDSLQASVLQGTLAIGTRVLGVITVAMPRPEDFGARERSIFHTLCAYGAIALDNAAAYANAERARHEANQALDELRLAQAERRDAEARRASLEAQLREAQKMEAIGTLAGGVAHDFNNILATILGNAELARLDLRGQSAALESLDEIRKAGGRARDLVQQILSFSRRQPTELKRIDLAPVVDDALRLLRATLPARLAFDVRLDTRLPPVLADATQIQQVIINLATNAMQAMPEGPGRIGVRLDAVPLDATLAHARPVLRPLLGRAATLLRLAIHDDGVGIDAATLGRIFEPFFTTKAVGEGTGLGLSVVHGIVQAHGGAIDVDSRPGQGSTFTIYLPALAEAPAAPSDGDDAAAAASGEPQAPASRGTRILYIDDDQALVFLMQRLLGRRGYRVVGHNDPATALDVLRADPAAFDVVVTDYNMPGKSGLDVARDVRAIRADLPVAVISGFVDEKLHAQASAAGVRELIFKATSTTELCASMARLADSIAG